MTQISKTNVFTYGSLMYPQVIQKLIKNTYTFQKVLLKGYERRHVKNKVYPGIIARQKAQVQGVVYYGVNEQDMRSLDYFQSVQYLPTKVQVITNQGKKIEAVVYVYVDQNNLEASEWRIQDFENLHKNSFANSHLQVKATADQNQNLSSA